HADAARAIDALRDEAMARGSLPLRAAAAWYDAELALRTGRVAIAENAARAAFDVADGCAGLFSGPATGVLIRALAERGAFDEARELLRERGLAGRLGARWWELDVGHARARLWLAEGDFERA